MGIPDQHGHHSTFRTHSDGSNCGTDPFVLVRPDKLDQQASSSHRFQHRRRITGGQIRHQPRDGHGTASPRRVSGWPDGAPRSLLYPMSGRPLHHTTGNPDQRLAAPAEQFYVLPRDLGTAIDFALTHHEVIKGRLRRTTQPPNRRELAAAAPRLPERDWWRAADPLPSRLLPGLGPRSG